MQIPNRNFGDSTAARSAACPPATAHLTVRRTVALVEAVGLLLVLTACGGGSNSAGPDSPVPAPPVPAPPAPEPPVITSVAVSCLPTTVAPGGTAQCTATVSGSGSYSSAVEWSSSGGSISQSGALTAPPNAGSVDVTATSTADDTKSGKVTVTVLAPPPRPPPHIVLVMEENKSYADVAGNTTDWPNLNRPISNGALATNYFADTHPSIGNYLMLTTGQILTNDDSSTQVWNVDNLARRMIAANVSFRVYAEGITQGYVGGNDGSYFVRHNPFALLSDIANDPQAANEHIWPFSQFAVDLANGNLPEFSYIVPDIDDDAHDGSSSAADSWLETQVVVPLSDDPAFAPGGEGLLIVNFDEAADSDAQHGGGHVAVVFWGPMARMGYQQTSSTIYQHQSLLRTMMEILGLKDPPGAAAAAPSMQEFLVHPPQP